MHPLTVPPPTIKMYPPNLSGKKMLNFALTGWIRLQWIELPLLFLQPPPDSFCPRPGILCYVTEAAYDAMEVPF